MSDDLPWATVAATPFHGETMTCFECGRQELSDPTKESGWYVFDLYDEEKNVVRYYWCGRCKP